jgi:PAS domain S-box-containing protein
MSGGWVPRQHTVHRAVLELGETFRAEHDLPSLLKVAADVVLGVIHSDVVAILEVGSDGKSLRGLAAAGIDSAASMRRISEQPDSWSSEAMRSGRTVVVRDLFHDRRFATDIPSASGGAQGGSRVMLSGITVSINQASDSPPPLAGERRVGAFGVLTGRSWKPRAFTAAHVRVVEDAAALLARTLARRASELRLRDSEERFRLLAERSPDALFRTRMLPEPRIEYLSPSIESLTGRSVHELLHSEDRAAMWKVIHPDDRDKGREYIANPTGATAPLLLRYVHTNGSVVWTEQRMTPIFDRGTLVAWEGVIRDVTSRVLAERRQQAQAQLTQLILEGRQASEVLNAAAIHVSRLSDADYAFLALPTTSGRGWAVRIVSGDPAKTPQEIVLPDADPVIARVTSGRTTVMIENLSTALSADHALRRLGWMGSVLIEPIRGSNGLLGILGVANVTEGRRFSDIGITAVGDLARQAALAIEYEHARGDLQRLAVLEDRARISRELHDGVIQSLFGAGMMLEGISGTEEVSPATRDGIARVATMIDNTMVDVRSYIFDLRPSALTGRNLDQGLRLLAEDFEKATSIPCSVDIDAGALAGLEGAAPQLIQIAREALSNVARHARPKHCWLALRREGNDSILEIRDDGRGFKSAQLTAGSGLKNMSGRAAEIGASVEFISPISPSPSAGGQGGGAIVRAHWLLSRTTTSAEPQPGAKLER